MCKVPEVKLHTFLFLGEDERQWLASSYGRITTEKVAPAVDGVECYVDRKATVWTRQGRPYRESNPGRLVLELVWLS